MNEENIEIYLKIIRIGLEHGFITPAEMKLMIKNALYKVIKNK